MRMRLHTFPAFLILMMTAAIAAIPTSASEDGHFDRTLTVSGPVDLEVHTGSGNITVRAGNSGKVEVHGKIHTNGWHIGQDINARIHELETNPPIEQNGNTICVGHIEDHEKLRNISISYELFVPAETKLHSSSGSGDESIDGISGPADSSSGSGNLRLTNIGGEARARTGSGDIELNSIRGNTRASAGSGTIHATGIAGGFNGSSGSGDIRAEQTAAGDVEVSAGSGSVEIKGVKGAVHATTGSGNISAQGEPAGEWKIHTGSGDVTVELPQQAAFEFLARTSSGSIESNHEMAVQGTITPHELHGKVRGGGVLVDLSTSSGSIKIR